MKLRFSILTEQRLYAVLEAIDAANLINSSDASALYHRVLHLLSAASRPVYLLEASSTAHLASLPVMQIFCHVRKIVSLVSSSRLEFTLADLVDARPTRTRVFLSAVFAYAVMHSRYCDILRRMRAARDARCRSVAFQLYRHEVALVNFNKLYYQYNDSRLLLAEVNAELLKSNNGFKVNAYRYKELIARRDTLFARKSYLEDAKMRLDTQISTCRSYMDDILEDHRNPSLEVAICVARITAVYQRITRLQVEINEGMACHERMRELYRESQVCKQRRRDLAEVEARLEKEQVPSSFPETAVEEDMYVKVEVDTVVEAQLDVDNEDTQEELAGLTAYVAALEAYQREMLENQNRLTNQTVMLRKHAEELQNGLCLQFNEYLRAATVYAQECDMVRMSFVAHERKLTRLAE